MPPFSHPHRWICRWHA